MARQLNDIRQVLDRAMRTSPDAKTTRELVAETGIAVGRLREALRLLIQAGEWEPVTVARETMASTPERPRMQWVTGYRKKQKKRRKAAK